MVPREVAQVPLLADPSVSIKPAKVSTDLPTSQSNLMGDWWAEWLLD